MLNALGEIGGILSSVLSLSIVGTLTAVLGTVISNFDFAFKRVVKDVGLGFDIVGKNVKQTFMDLRSDVVRAGLEFKDLTDSTRQLADNFGFAVTEAQQLSFDIADGAKALGVQADTMATLVGQFALVGDISKEQSHLLSEQIGLLAAQNDVAPQAVLKDIANSTEEMALFSKGGIKNFAQTAIEARKLGMSVKDVANTLKGMLNFEDSLNKELQASVMLGKNINLNEARRLTFAGDTAGAFQAIAKELGDVDLGSLDPLTLQSVADAAGMSTEQLLKMSKGAEEMGGVDMGEEALSAQDVAALRARDTLSKMEKVLADSQDLAIDLADAIGPGLTDALQQFVDFLSSFDMTELKNKFDKFIEDLEKMSWEEVGKKIGTMLSGGIMAALDVAKPLFKGFFESLGDSTAGSFLKSFGALVAAAGKGPLGAIAKIFKIGILKPIELIGKGIKALNKRFKLMNTYFDTATKRFRKLNGQFTKVSTFRKAFQSIASTFSKIVTFAKSALQPFAKVGNAIFRFVKVFGRLGKFIPYLGQVLMIFDGIMGGVNRASEATTGFGKVVAFVFGAAEGVVRGLITAITDVVDYMFGTDITAAFNNMADTVVNAFTGAPAKVLEFFTDLPNKVANLFSGIGETIGDIITTSIKGVGNLASLIGDLFIGAGDLVVTGAGIGKDLFKKMFDASVEAVKDVPTAIANTFGNLGKMVKDKMVGAFDEIGSYFAEVGDYILNLFPAINFTKIAEDMTSGIRSAFAGIKRMFVYPINKLIDVFNGVKEAISNKLVFKGYTLIKAGGIVDNELLGTFPKKNIAIPEIRTPNLGPDFEKLHMGGKIKSDGLVEARKGEVYAGAGDAAFKPIADEIHSLKSDIAQTNQLLSRILSEGIPVMKA